MSSSKVPALRQGVDILFFLAASTTPCRAPTIYNALGIPRSKTYHLLAVLCEYGLVIRDRDGEYRLGRDVLKLIAGYLGHHTGVSFHVGISCDPKPPHPFE